MYHETATKQVKEVVFESLFFLTIITLKASTTEGKTHFSHWLSIGLEVSMHNINQWFSVLVVGDHCPAGFCSNQALNYISELLIELIICLI